jgi:hypothetical protein
LFEFNPQLEDISHPCDSHGQGDILEEDASDHFASLEKETYQQRKG